MFFNCKEATKEKERSFTFIDRGDYVINRDFETNQLMDGYYVIGNELSKWEEFNLKNGVLNGEENKRKRIDVKANPQEAMKYMEFLLKI
jgi:hypothetical protein